MMDDLDLFNDKGLVVFIHGRSSDSDSSSINHHARIIIRNDCSAFLIFSSQRSNDEKEEAEVYVLDLLVDITRLDKEKDHAGNLWTATYYYQRNDISVKFEIIPANEEMVGLVQRFDFALGQYVFTISDCQSDDTIGTGNIGGHTPNIIARGLEGGGVVMRTALRSGGRYTGHAIRYLGRHYTSLSLPQKKSSDESTPATLPSCSVHDNADIDEPVNDEQTSRSSTPVDEKTLRRAHSVKHWAEGVHSGARTVTGAALFPVRWTGRKASEWAGRGGNDKPATEVGGPITRSLSDIVTGAGNGIASACKGVTEAIGEVGTAVGDSAMHHAITRHGEDYASKVTQCYVDAASELGLAGYKVCNVMAIGWQGIMLDAMIEGTILAVSLYEYLLGPILLQGYVDMVQLPQTERRRYFAVLRPWSISFYLKAADITKKPYKIIPTSLLDTIPRLRIRSATAHALQETVTNQSYEVTVTGDDLPESTSISMHANYDLNEDVPHEMEGSFVLLNSAPNNKVQDNDHIKSDGLQKVSEEFKTSGDLKSTEMSRNPKPQLIPSPALRGLSAGLAIDDISYDILADNDYWQRCDYDAFEEQAEEMSNNLQANQTDPQRNNSDDIDRAEPDSRSSCTSLLHRMSQCTNESSSKIRSILRKWNGSMIDHIELCTVDCSSYLMFPCQINDLTAAFDPRIQSSKIDPANFLSGIEETQQSTLSNESKDGDDLGVLLSWYNELRKASKRVETIANRVNDAQNMALQRRLSLYPKTDIIEIKVKRFVKTLKPRRNGLFNSLSCQTDRAAGAILPPYSTLCCSTVNQDFQCEDSNNGVNLSIPGDTMQDRNDSSGDQVSIGAPLWTVERGADIGEERISPKLNVTGIAHNEALSTQEEEYGQEDFTFIENCKVGNDDFALDSGDEDLQRAVHDPTLNQKGDTSGDLPVASLSQSVASIPLHSLDRLPEDEPTLPALATEVNEYNAGTSSNKQRRSRPFFSAKVKVSFTPITCRGLEVTDEKQVTSPATLLSLPIYLSELSTTVEEMNHLLSSRQDAQDSREVDQHRNPEDLERIYESTIRLHKTYDLYAQVAAGGGRKLVADWEAVDEKRKFCVDNTSSSFHKAPSSSVEIGKVVNILGSENDCPKIKVRIHCRSKHLLHYATVGEAIIDVRDIPTSFTSKDNRRTSEEEMWVPILKHGLESSVDDKEPEQLGALLVNIKRLNIAGGVE